MKRKLLLIAMLISGCAFGQISITYSDYESAFSPGTTYKSHMVPITGNMISVFVGEASPTAQYWDLSGYTFEYVARSVGINPADAPFYSDFPTSTAVLYEKSWYSTRDTIHNWNYKKLQADRLLLLGISDLYNILYTYDPPVIQAMVPLTYGSSWQRQRDSTYIMPEYWIITEGLVVVDAFGTMKLPSGQYDCLRLTQKNLVINHSPVGVDTTEDRSYHFLCQGAGRSQSAAHHGKSIQSDNHSNP
jgi:hypothetical protein